MNATIEHPPISLPGYTLSSRLGAGGYGEVWLAQAPGGLTKAVKFIFGSFHEKRAEHELRALRRMKDLRHPFLLSLERIEVIDSRLVIVTELAESSLKDRFDQCQQQGLPGIPRPELLKYLDDAADALDFLSSKHSLQHLDVKPENLLLVAGHVKVADFGLVKDVHDSRASLMGGLTPLYSAPEVFQGCPSVQSDQYSLAVLYQEMLTGRLPFDGSTAAELTMQHLHDEPDVSPLPIADRFVLSRALSKDPAHRFGSCREFIQSLSVADAGAWSDAPREVAPEAGGQAPPPERRATPRAGSVTEFFGDVPDGKPKEISESMLLDWKLPPASSPRMLPPLQLPPGDFAAAPTLVIGVGGMAAAVLRNFRARLSRRLGDAPAPAVQFLLLDTDAKTVAAAMQGDSRSALKSEETLVLPLRRPQDYRENSGRLMRWLSRRWLYNIPKSLRTEGLRPLGRLALADHARQAAQRIRLSLAHAADPQSIGESNGQGGFSFRPGSARVYLVASIDGGAGSGMSLDVGYAARAALDKAGVADAQILGVFLHSAGRDPRQCDLARVNAHAWLTEYNHFHREGGQFPGDESCGLPAMPPGRRAFDSAYLIDFSSEGDPREGDEVAQAVADYLYLDALTPAQGFFAACRQEPVSATAPTAPLRTFRLERVVATPDAAVEAASDLVSREVVAGWVGGVAVDAHALRSTPKPRDTDQLVTGAATLVLHLQLKLDGLASNSRRLIEAQFGGDLDAFIASLLAHAAADNRPPSGAESVQMIDCLFASSDLQSERQILERPLESILSPLATRLADDLARWTLQKLDDRQQRLPGARRAAQWLVDHLTRVEADASRLAAALGRQIDVQAAELRPLAGSTAEARKLAAQYFRIRLDQQAVLAAAIISRRLIADLRTLDETIIEFRRHATQLLASLPPAGPANADPLRAVVISSAAKLADEVDGRLQAEFIDRRGGLLQTIMGDPRLRGQLLTALRGLSRQAVESLAAQANAVLPATDRFPAGRPGLEPPRLLQHGGACRCLAVLPGSASGSVPALLGGALAESAVTVVPGDSRDVILCYEAWDLPLVRIAVDLIHRRRDYADFAARVATRSDVPWTPLMAPAAAAPIADGPGQLPFPEPTTTRVL